MIVTIVSLIFLSASKLFIAEVLMEKKSMPDSFWVWGGGDTAEPRATCGWWGTAGGDGSLSPIGC